MIEREPEPGTAPGAGDGIASLGLVLATALWGCSFTWAKAGGADINQAAGLEPGSPLGPVLFLAARFCLAAVLWAAVAPTARRGWTWGSIRRGGVLGLLLWAAMMVQMLGLDRTSEAVSAFLTSLTVVFVPLAMTFILRRPPRPAMWIAVAIAAAGIWLMTGATPTGFGAGELLGLACAIGFSAHLIVLNEVMRRESVGRMTLIQFAVTGLAALAVCPFVPGGDVVFSPGGAWTILASGGVGRKVILVTLVSTVGAFGLVFRFQPRLAPTRAALIYLAEPIFAAIFAYLVNGRTLAPVALGGAVLILVANAFAEIAGRWRRRGSVRVEIPGSSHPPTP